MRTLDFFKIGREKQERFLASSRGNAPPAPLVQVRGDGGRALRWAGLSAAAVLALLLLYVLRYGVLGAPLAMHGFVALLLYLGFGFLIPYAALRAVGSVLAGRSLPYRPGVYVFPMVLIDARSKVLRVFPMADATRIEPATAGGALKLAFKGGRSYSFPTRDAADAEQANRALDLAKAQVEHALANNDDSELVTLDPFYEAKRGWTSPIGPKDALVDRSPAWRRFDYAVAAGCALLIGPLLWSLHNKGSDDTMLKKAVALNTPAAYESYLAVGKRHTDEVKNVLLPRAELEGAKADKSVEAIQAFMAAHPNSAIDNEAQAALREALLRELDKARAAGSLAALGAFAKKYPAHHLDKEYAAAVHALYQGALLRFKARAANESPRLATFMQQLAEWLEKHGTTVTVAFRREVSSGLAQADKVLGTIRTNRAFGPHQVTKYFDTAASQPKESEVVAALQKELGEIFAPDLIELQKGPDLADADAATALAQKGPLIVIHYRFGWMGTAYGSVQLKRAFAGLYVDGSATLSVPGGEPYRIRLSVGPPRGLPLEYKSVNDGLSSPPAPDGAPPEPAIYRAQDLRALDRITSIVENAIVKPATK